MQADPDIVAAWVAGWAKSREVAPPTPFHSGHYVEVGLVQHRSRYVFPALDEALLRRLTDEVSEPWIFLKVFSPSPRLDWDWPAPWAVQPHGFMMTAAFSSPDQPALTAGYRLSVEGDSVIGATIYESAGEIAASGKAALANGHAVFDQIVTNESHRRRGLGRVVMQALSAAALAREICRGVLVATPDGRALYATLGWRFQAFLTTAVMAGPEA
jgi:GNAT superfamily N-acetyltransferase